MNGQKVFSKGAASAITAITFALTGCQGDSEGVSIPAGYEDLERCAVDRPVPVEELATDPALRDCDPQGVTVIYPDGQTIKVDEVGAAQASFPQTGNSYELTNWGVPGISAAYDDSAGIAVWGTRAAVKLHIEVLYKDGAGYLQD